MASAKKTQAKQLAAALASIVTIQAVISKVTSGSAATAPIGLSLLR
jgi:hypothetical protein